MLDYIRERYSVQNKQNRPQDRALGDTVADRGKVSVRLIMKACLTLAQESKSHYRTMTKTRTYMKDGKVVTSTTTKLVVSGQENKVKEEHNIR